MTRGKTIAIAVSVMGGGVAVAMLFRHEPPAEPPTAPTVVSELKPNTERQKPHDVAASRPQLLGRIGPPLSSTSRQKSTFRLRPDAPAALAPSESKGPWQFADRSDDFPARRSASPFASSQSQAGPPRTNDQRTAQQFATASPTTEPSVRRHVIRDGDTLTYLAQHYLGSASRHLEIFRANREVLRHPDLLPIGLKLKIPPRDRPAPARVERDGQIDRMVPIRPGALDRHRENR